MPTINTKRFVLRSFRKGDEKSLTENINDKDIYKFTLRIPHPYTLKDGKRWIKDSIKLQKNKKKDKVNFAIDINGGVVGGIGIQNIENYKAEIGYWLGKKYWKKGIMTEALKIVTNYGFYKLKLKRIYAYVFPKNKASIYVLENNGYKCEGLLKKHALKDGKFMNGLVYAKVR